ncbi:MAG: GerW family sporulation protein [Oscillospiraceae bacterium]|nr:GerW family sporulation protein [Oscillospiraceae bacterium]
MDNTPIRDLMDVTMSKLKELVDANTVVGTPVTTPDDITVIPVSKMSFAFASGGSEFPQKEKTGFGGGNGAGIKVEPVGFLVIKDGNVRMINIAPPPESTVDRLIELIPEIIEHAEAFIDKRKK